MSKSITICTCGNPEGHVGNVWHPGQPIPEGIKLTEAELLAKLKTATTSMNPRSVEVGVAVVKCGCGDPNSHNGSNGEPARPCPRPRAAVDLGVVDRKDRNILKRLHWLLIGKPAADKRIRAANQI